MITPSKSTNSKKQPQPQLSGASEPAPHKARTIKLAVDVHLDVYVVARVIDVTARRPTCAQLGNFLGGQMLWLGAGLLELMDFDKTELGEAPGDVIAPGLAGVVFVHHDDDLALAVGMFPTGFRL